jgi:glutamine synthetase
MNPYLALAACLAAGLDGIKKKMTPPESVDSNIFQMTEAEMKNRGMEMMPKTLGDAVEAFENSTFMKEVLGPQIFTKYAEAKHAEWRKFRAIVTDWEVGEYLYKY